MHNLLKSRKPVPRIQWMHPGASCLFPHIDAFGKETVRTRFISNIPWWQDPLWARDLFRRPITPNPSAQLRIHRGEDIRCRFGATSGATFRATGAINTIRRLRAQDGETLQRHQPPIASLSWEKRCKESRNWNHLRDQKFIVHWVSGSGRKS